MYLHEAIQDIRGQKLRQGDEFRLAALEMMMRAQCFHIGEEIDVAIMRANQIANKEPLFTKWAQFMKLPYPVIWLDFRALETNIQPDEKSAPKRALLVQQGEDNVLQIIPFLWFAELRAWSLSVYGFQITPSIEGGSTRVFVAKEVSFFDDITLEKLVYEYQSELTTLETALALLNCKNVEIETVVPSEKLNKKRTRTGKVPIFTYKVLKVRPQLPGQKLDATEKEETVAVHLCRGHFKEYTSEAPLFGKYVGLWWWQPMVRGDKSKGLIAKDYEI